MNVIQFRKIARKCYCGQERFSHTILYCEEHAQEILDKYYETKRKKDYALNRA